MPLYIISLQWLATTVCLRHPIKTKLDSMDILNQWNMNKSKQKTVDLKDTSKFAEEMGLLPTRNVVFIRQIFYNHASEKGYFTCCKGSLGAEERVAS